MAISKKIIDLTNLALKDRTLTSIERETIVKAALNEGTSAEEINAFLDQALQNRQKSYTKEELKCCPNCGTQIPLISQQCPSCGTMLNHVVDTKHVKISSDEAEIINRENVKTEEEQLSLKKCPDCGAPFPLISNICTHCGHVLHQNSDNEFNIQNLLDNIQVSIQNLRNAPNPSFGQVLLYRLDVIVFYFAATFLLLSFFTNIEYLCLSFVFLIISIVFLFASFKNNSPVEVANEVFYEALNNEVMYLRQTDTIYGENKEARKLINDLSNEIKIIKNKRNKNRLMITTLFLVLMSIPVILYIKSPSTKELYDIDRTEYPEIYQMSEYTKIIKPLPGYSVHNNYQDYFEANCDTKLSFDVISFNNRINSDTDSVRYNLRIDPVKIVSKGKKIEKPDTCMLRIFLWDKDKKPVGKSLYPLKIRAHDNDDDVTIMLKNGFGNYEADFTSLKTTKSIEKLRQIADSVCYYTVY